MRKTFASRAVGLLPFFLVLGPSCSLVYDLSNDQCSTNADCDHFGPGMVCNSGICACGNKSQCGSGTTGGTGGSGTGGTTLGGTGGTDGGTGGTVLTGGTGGDAGMGPEVGGTSAVGGTGAASGGSTGAKGGSGGKGGTSGKGGTGNTGNESGAAGMTQGPECVTHNDCFVAYPDDSDVNPRACVQGTCVPLMTDECPIVLPHSDNGVWTALKSTDAIILGAFGPVSNATLNTIGRNYDLAVTEFSTTGGVYSGSSKQHQIVMVLCNEAVQNQVDLLKPAKHLMEELQVPGVVSALLLQDQHYVWENVAQPNGTFMIMPLYSDQALIDTADDGLIWNMLSGADALSVSYQPLLDMTIDHLRLNGNLGSTEAVRVAHVEATDEPFLNDTALYLDANLQFNGQSVSANLNATPQLFDGIPITSAYTAPTDTQSTAIGRILALKPHIVIGTTEDEMLKYIIPGVESGWDDASQNRPFYLLGALDYNDTQMQSLCQHDPSPTATPPQLPLSQRILGINWPSAPDDTVYQQYQDRWKKKYGTAQPGYENFYDPAWYLMYAVAAARYPITGTGIANAFPRIIATTSGTPVVDIGPGDDLDAYVGSLSSNSKQKIELVGAMGPPTWDPNGARHDPGSVWCLDNLGNFQPDQMRYDAGPPAALTGKIDPSKCFTFDGMQ